MRLAALLHDSDDKKLFPGSKPDTNLNAILEEALI